MATILFATWDGGGNVPPMLALAGELQRRGHSVRVLGHAQQEAGVTAAGLAFTGYPTARRFSSAVGPSIVALTRVFGDKAMGTDVVTEVRQHSADLVVVDCLLPGVMDALRREGTPYIVLEHLFDGYLRGPGLKSPIGLGLRLKGLKPVDLLDHARLCLVATLADLDPATALAANAVHTGPFVTGRSSTPETPTVLVSLSTYTYPGMGPAWQRVLDAVADLPIRVIATTGPAVDPTRLRAGSNTELRAWAPHGEVMPHVSMVIGHGGHSTTMLALAHDLPLLVMPMFALVDQPMVGKAIEAAGAGLLMKKSSSSAQIRAAVEKVLSDDTFRAGASRLGAQVRDLHGLGHAAELVEEQVHNGVRQAG
jgi:UDP:flavonoid glycosyltransferase YjiC (YdhE family)